MIVLDTHILLWRAFEPGKISSKAADALRLAQKTCVNSISIWEIGIKIKNKKLEIPLSLADFVAHLDYVEGFKIIPVDEKIWMDSLELKWHHRDPADRVIVATAKRMGSALVTSDKEIKKFYRKTIW